MTKFLDELMMQLYSCTLSIMDVAVISILSVLGQDIHWSIWLLILPWIVYSTRQKFKYDEQ